MSSLKLHSRLALATLVATLVASTLVATTMAGLATPASAAVPGLTIITATSATDSDDHKGVRADCPAGTVAIGSGATIQGGLGQVNIESVVPSTNSVSALAYEDANGTNNLWSVTAQAVCANPPPGHTLVYATSIQDSNNKSVTASCPGNTVTIGSGALLGGSFGDVELEEIRPQLDQRDRHRQRDRWTGSGNQWCVVAYASCADPLAGLVTVATSSANTAANKSVVATCPAGTSVLNAAGRLNNGNGRVVIDDLFATATTVTATGKETGSGTGTRGGCRRSPSAPRRSADLNSLSRKAAVERSQSSGPLGSPSPILKDRVHNKPIRGLDTVLRTVWSAADGRQCHAPARRPEPRDVWVSETPPSATPTGTASRACAHRRWGSTPRRVCPGRTWAPVST